MEHLRGVLLCHVCLILPLAAAFPFSRLRKRTAVGAIKSGAHEAGGRGRIPRQPHAARAVVQRFERHAEAAGRLCRRQVTIGVQVVQLEGKGRLVGENAGRVVV